MLYSPPTRWHAFAVHLIFSALILIALMLVITQLWFPSVFMQMGGWQGVKIVAAVDVVLGPLLTLLIYKVDKPGIKMDLAVILLIQMSCLTTGMWLVYKERPLAQVYVADSVYVLSQMDLNEYGISQSDLDDFAGDYPKALYLDLPKDLEQIKSLEYISAFTGGEPIQLRLDLYRELKGPADDVNWRFTLLEENSGSDCRWLKVENKHFTGEGCFNLKQGLVLIGNKKALDSSTL